MPNGLRSTRLFACIVHRRRTVPSHSCILRLIIRAFAACAPTRRNSANGRMRMSAPIIHSFIVSGYSEYSPRSLSADVSILRSVYSVYSIDMLQCYSATVLPVRPVALGHRPTRSLLRRQCEGLDYSARPAVHESTRLESHFASRRKGSERVFLKQPWQLSAVRGLGSIRCAVEVQSWIGSVLGFLSQTAGWV